MGTHCTGETRTALYRFYDARETLLYVGISVDPWRRWREHVLDKPWYPQVRHQSVTWYDSEREARKAETRAIRSERPRFNVAGAVRPPEARLSLRSGPVIQACAWWMAVPGVLAVVTLAVAMAAHMVGGLFVDISGWAIMVTMFSLPVPIVAALLVAGSSQIHRFGCWLDRNFAAPAGPDSTE
jgi:GIY-YIG catalytic domain